MVRLPETFKCKSLHLCQQDLHLRKLDIVTPWIVQEVSCGNHQVSARVCSDGKLRHQTYVVTVKNTDTRLEVFNRCVIYQFKHISLIVNGNTINIVSSSLFVNACIACQHTK